ncbi:hypothetical protein [Flavobacterium johnsoniae]|jgi:hypothetical protein|uniref:CarboxypepD_reg-like domain-containing protein n=1 Tax=Flavobacterium johnsoniae (strain ATCC 17061 / DSM 2064 / JCM 8514 / BCRC 14874 / CCUG 350202 / NBRC 14942 / NCIMB 11054 / UW101) TaxID=376686 RepID=A5FJ21_FLAJ1|nr:hypothetical protein [Flavobacterium johnsoniae]ABQ04803.1 hypothetical protein Fjoh_1771 [Flavobacterium johnsoniae UW101]OXG02995.1 hypothetical protein B0A63_01710 [Flavobacterium johnsoniae UW101]WQG83399.1 hypothetical protein SR927_09845 [Flavobacterium johnsoniae UW101]SHK34558.1 hypothetical protein SAMN05444146_1218 [Flavobacterium johnsoniae]
MKNKLGVFVVCLFCQIMLGQNGTRKSLHGQVTNKSLAIESGYVMNINAKSRTFIGPGGLFDILAQPKDTLLFTGIAFQSKKIVLTEKDCSQILFSVSLDLVSNELKEVLVRKDLKVKSLDSNTQKYVDMQFEDDRQSTAKNTVMYSDQTIKYGTDFVRIFKDVKKLLSKNNEKEEVISDIAFVEYSKANFKPDFYTKTLGLKPDEVDLFLMFCSNDPESKRHLNEDQKFELIDFLINKNAEFKKVNAAQ